MTETDGPSPFSQKPLVESRSPKNNEKMKKLKGGRHSDSVRLLSSGVVAKQYDLSKPHHRRWFERELSWMKRLKTESTYAPKFLGFKSDGKKRAIIYMTYAGKRLSRKFTSKEKALVQDALEQLKSKHQIQWKSPHPPRSDNIVWKNGRPALIDFNSRWWQHAPTN
jgi:hypothetical protein